MSVIRLAPAPGTTQVDFGQARASIAGVECAARFPVVSYPYPDMRYVAALGGVDPDGAIKTTWAIDPTPDSTH